MSHRDARRLGNYLGLPPKFMDDFMSKPEPTPVNEQPVNEQRVAARIAGRKEAGELIGFIDPLPHGNYYRDYYEAFMEELTKKLAPPQMKEPPPAPPTTPIGRFGNYVLPFGQYKGKTFDEVDLEYLDWLCREQEEFAKKLKSYLTHPDLESRRRGKDG